MIPEIIPIVLKKYTTKQVTPFPLKLEFIAKGGAKKYIYTLVAQSEHSGGMMGGHYWAICLRKNAENRLTWKNLNDQSVSDARPGPTLNSYVLIYHLISIENTNTDLENITRVTGLLK
jgi:ubiquitin C-terminal hydrolase